jgi:hypothetical protein
MRARLGLSHEDEDDDEYAHEREEGIAKASSNDRIAEEEMTGSLRDINPWVIAKMNASGQDRAPKQRRVEADVQPDALPYNAANALAAEYTTENSGAVALRRFPRVANGADLPMRRQEQRTSKVPGSAFRSPVTRSSPSNLNPDHRRPTIRASKFNPIQQQLFTPPSSDEHIRVRLQRAVPMPPPEYRLPARPSTNWTSAAHLSPIRFPAGQRVCDMQDGIIPAEDNALKMQRDRNCQSVNKQADTGSPIHAEQGRENPPNGALKAFERSRSDANLDPRLTLISRQRSVRACPLKTRRRLSTKRLPLECIPHAEETYVLVQRIDLTTMSSLHSSYVETSGEGLTGCLSARAVAGLENRLRSVVQHAFGNIRGVQDLDITLEELGKGKAAVM